MSDLLENTVGVGFDYHTDGPWDPGIYAGIRDLPGEDNVYFINLQLQRGRAQYDTSAEYSFNQTLEIAGQQKDVQSFGIRSPEFSGSALAATTSLRFNRETTDVEGLDMLDPTLSIGLGVSLDTGDFLFDTQAKIANSEPWREPVWDGVGFEVGNTTAEITPGKLREIRVPGSGNNEPNERLFTPDISPWTGGSAVTNQSFTRDLLNNLFKFEEPVGKDN